MDLWRSAGLRFAEISRPAQCKLSSQTLSDAESRETEIQKLASRRLSLAKSGSFGRSCPVCEEVFGVTPQETEES